MRCQQKKRKRNCEVYDGVGSFIIFFRWAFFASAKTGPDWTGFIFIVFRGYPPFFAVVTEFCILRIALAHEVGIQNRFLSFWSHWSRLDLTFWLERLGYRYICCHMGFYLQP